MFGSISLHVSPLPPNLHLQCFLLKNSHRLAPRDTDGADGLKGCYSGKNVQLIGKRHLKDRWDFAKPSHDFV